MSTTPVGRGDEMIAYFVAGPQHGATMVLHRGVDHYKFPRQEQIAATIEADRVGLTIPAVDMKYDLYERTKELSNRYLRGCYVFEWMGGPT